MNVRPPIVVVLGHVDHGKTTLLDYIRKTNVVAKEAGEITQHIGAYQAEVEGKKITFIDTPGHEAFEKMRSRGAQVADLAILVVAANDGVMPQTKEAIRHIKEAKIPMIVAINKTDLPAINLEKIKKQLAKEGVLLEGYGGQVVAVPISAKTGKGVKDLLEMILLLAEMEKIRADPQGDLEAVVIESQLDRHRGPVASVIIKNGSLHQADEVFSQNRSSRIRALISDKGQRLSEAGPGWPVEILGLETVPPVGLILRHQPVEKEEGKLLVKEAAKENQLKLILKTDVLGSLEAIVASLKTIPVEIITSNTGDVSESDVLLAKTTQAIILGFNVKVPSQVAKLAETEKVKIKVYTIIYELLAEINDVLQALASPQEEILGQAEVIADFQTSDGRVAGCQVAAGRLAVGDQVKVLRQEKEIGRARIKSLKQEKESVSKVEMGQKSGVLLAPILDFTIGDIIISQR